MKVPLSWVSLFCPVSETLESLGAKSLAHEYSIRTAEIEGIETYAFDSNIVVAKVLATSKHPDSDHLNLVRVSIGTSERGIVCWAGNVVGAQYVVLATEWAKLPGGFEIKKAKIRWQDSEGMICSLDELGLQENRAEGIFRLEEAFAPELLESRVGTPFAKLPLDIPNLSGSTHSLNLGETVFEIDNKFITNRPDLFSVEGNAREFGALFHLPFQPYQENSKLRESAPKMETSIESDRVLSYELVRIDGAKAQKSPFAIETLLTRAGVNPKYDLVDITNFVMTELGQPMHAFDADKIEGRIMVRLACENESILALDGKEYRLWVEDLVIADEKKILAVAGVIGGASSAVSETTENVIFESATFDPISVRLTAQRIGCRTDASTRYEKSLDPLLTSRAMSRAISLLEFLGKNTEISGNFAYVNEKRLKKAEISFPLAFVKRKLGIEVPSEEIWKILVALGFQTTVTKETITVQVPSWRVTKDISIKEDIVEEIGRVYGYSRIKEAPFVAPYDIALKNRNIGFRNSILSHFPARGYFEAYTYSFSNAEKDQNIGFSSMEDAVQIINAVSEEYTHMRRSPAPLLIEAAAKNLKHSEEFGFFEYGKIHKKIGGKFLETRSLAGISVWKPLLSLRGDVGDFIRSVAPMEEISIRQWTPTVQYPFLHPGKSGEILLKNERVAIFGTLHPKVAAIYDLESVEVAYFEFEVSNLMGVSFERSEPKFLEPGKFPGVTRELNFVMDERSLTGNAAAIIASCDSRVKNVVVADIFRDASKVGEGRKSVTFSFEVEDPGKTLTDEEALAVQTGIIQEMSKHGFLLRGAL